MASSFAMKIDLMGFTPLPSPVFFPDCSNNVKDLESGRPNHLFNRALHPRDVFLELGGT